MPLIKRLTRAFTADIHAVLDTIEEPASLLKQAVREMEDDVLNDQQHLKQLFKVKDHQQNTQRDYQLQLNGIEEEIEVSFAASEHELARKAIRRKLELERAIKLLSRQQQSTSAQIDELQQRLRENQEKLNAMRQKQEVLVNSNAGNSIDVQPREAEVTVTDDEVEIAFIKEQRSREKQARASS